MRRGTCSNLVVSDSPAHEHVRGEDSGRYPRQVPYSRYQGLVIEKVVEEALHVTSLDSHQGPDTVVWRGFKGLKCTLLINTLCDCPMSTVISDDISVNSIGS